MHQIAILTITVGAALLSGCATTERQSSVVTSRTETRERHTFGLASRFESATGSPRINISVGSQQAYFYKGGELIASTPVSTGRSGYRTPKGSFRISQKSVNHRSNRYGQLVSSSGAVIDSDADSRQSRPKGARFVGASMPYFMRFNGGIGMHQGYVPGYPASHGCVRLPAQMAQLFYYNAPIGTPVVVTE